MSNQLTGNRQPGNIASYFGAYRRVLFPCLCALFVFSAVFLLILHDTKPISQVAESELVLEPEGGPLILSDLPDFNQITDITQRKERFFSLIRPIVEEENSRISQQRHRLLELMGQYNLNSFVTGEDLTWLYSLAKEYKVQGFSPEYESSWNTLMVRVDIIPVPLALVQAAIESAWGTSRLSLASNNIYGQWCFSAGLGIVPARRDSGATHEIARYPSINQSVRSYLLNLNTHAAYGTLRRLRQEQRLASNKLDSYALAGGLVQYSERRGEYVKEIRSMLRYNQQLLVSV